MAKLVNSIIELIGETPIVKLNEIVPENAADVYVKLEYFNAGGSVKDRIAKNLIIAGEEAGVLKEGDTIIEASSGNTGVGLALVAATKKYSLVIVLPESVSNERKQLIRAFGAQVIETPAPLGIKGSFAEVEKLIAEKGYISLRQFENKHNPEAHYKTTGPEILAAFDNVLPDAFVSGVGTGGTITGTGKFLKENRADIKIVAVEPEKSPVLSGGVHSPHAIQGIGAGIVPEILDTTIYDEIIQVKDESAIETIQNLAAKEGLLLGVSSGAAIFAAIQIAEKLGKGKKVVVVAPDNGERYLSVGLF